MSDQTLSVSIIADASRFSAGIDNALSKLQKFGAQAERAGGVLSLAISAPLGLMAKKMADAFGESDSLARGLATLEKNSTTLQARLSKLNDIAKLPGLGFEEAVAGDIKLRTVMERLYGIEGAAKMSERTMLGFGNAVALVGKGKAEFDRALYGIQQMANTKFPLGEDLNIIKDAIPQVSTLLHEAFGTDRTEDLKKMGISSQRVIEVMLNGLEKLPKASGGWKNAMENMGNSVDKAMSTVFGSLDKVLGLTGLMDKFSGIIENIANRFASLSPMAQKAIGALAGMAIVLPPLLAGLGMLTTTVLPALAAGFAAITGPIGLAVVAVGAAVTLIVMHWDRIKQALVNSKIWNSLKDLVKNSLGAVLSYVGIFVNLFQGDWENMGKSVINSLKYTWNGILDLFAISFKALNSLSAKAAAAMGMDSIADKFREANKELDGFVEKLKFKNLPAVSGQIANMFEGFNFGGDREDKTGGGGGGAGGKGKKNKEADTWAERMRKDLKAVDDLIKEFEAKNPGKDDPSLAFMKMQKGYYQDLLKIDDKTDLPSSSDIGPVKSAAQRYWEAVANGWMTPMERQFQALKGNTAKMLGDVQQSIGRSLDSDELRKRILGIVPVNELEDRIADLVSSLRGGLGEYQRVASELLKLPEDQRATALETWTTFTQQVNALIETTLEGGLASLGDFLGKFMAGSQKIENLPSMVLSTVGDIAIQLGKLAIGIGIGAEAIKKALKSLSGIGAIAAGVGLIALGTMAKSGAAKIGGSVPALAEGGGAFGPTLAMIGDNPRASVDPEVVAPLSKLKNMMGGAGSNRSQGVGQVVFEIRGTDLVGVLKYANEAEYNNR